MIHGKKGMEMWQLVLMILALVLLVFILAWYAGLGTELKGLSEKLTEMF